MRDKNITINLLAETELELERQANQEKSQSDYKDRIYEKRIIGKAIDIIDNMYPDLEDYQPERWHLQYE